MNDDLPANAPPSRPTPAARYHRVPRGTGEFGMYLFLAALAMLFVSSMLGYALVRWTKTRTVYDPANPDLVRFAPTAPPFGTMDLPVMGLLFSTAVILASSVTMHLALKNVQRERQGKFRASLVATLILALGFVIAQTPSMWKLLTAHDANNISNTMYGLVFFLVLIHALHVIGGIIPLAITTYRAGQDRYDHEHYGPVKYVAMYWHFLDGVWIFMFTVLLITR